MHFIFVAALGHVKLTHDRLFSGLILITHSCQVLDKRCAQSLAIALFPIVYGFPN